MKTPNVRTSFCDVAKPLHGIKIKERGRELKGATGSDWTNGTLALERNLVLDPSDEIGVGFRVKDFN